MPQITQYRSNYGEWPVAYIITPEGRCIFTGMVNVLHCLSTINGVENIISAICTKENRGPRSLEFFDLQTHLGYAHVPLGEFAYDKVRFTRESTGDKFQWIPSQCPRSIIEAFRWCITYPSGPEPRQTNLANVRVKVR